MIIKVVFVGLRFGCSYMGLISKVMILKSDMHDAIWATWVWETADNKCH